MSDLEAVAICAVGGFIGGALSFCLFWFLNRHFEKKQSRRMRDTDGQFMSRSQMQRRHQVHENLKKELAR